MQKRPWKKWLGLFLAALVCVTADRPCDRTQAGEPLWKKHVVHTGFHTATAVAGDFTGDGRIDVISNSGGKTRLFVAPPSVASRSVASQWKQTILDDAPRHNCIHSEVMDIDGDGDLDWIGCRYSPGLVFWLEHPSHPLTQRWKYHLVDNRVNGIHGLLTADVDQDGKLDLLANSGQPTGPFANSAAWLRIPKHPRTARHWDRTVFADRDATGLSHYLGFGDVNGDGRPDISMAAKGGPTAQPGTGNWFAWWEAPRDSKKAGWTKHLIAANQPGATNIHPADVNGDGTIDFIASRGHGKGVVWFEGPGWKQHDIAPRLAGPHCLVVIDMDGDGDVDAATCAKDDKIAAWFENDGRGGFTTHVVARNQAAYDIRAIDMDRDGDLDLLIAGQTSKNVVWYENPRKRK